MSNRHPTNAGTPLRRGWTTGACATAATRAAYTALLSGEFPDPVTITLPRGQTPSFALAYEWRGDQAASAGIIKDAGDDPDVTHGALIKVTVRPSAAPGVHFAAGEGVGMVTKAGLPIDVGEPAINPVPRQMMRDTITELAARYDVAGDVTIEVSIPGGDVLAQQTWNPRLGIEGGLSILGTTGVVIPYSCAAWIHSIHRGIDVARANGWHHVAGCTGATSERVVQTRYQLPDFAMLDMGDFAGGLLKYLRTHPLPRLTIGGGFGKLSKLAFGHLDLHSGRSQVDLDWLRSEFTTAIPDATPLPADIGSANALLGATGVHRMAFAHHIATLAQRTAVMTLRDATITVDVVIIDRAGNLVGQTDA
ncbi:MAG: cobalt-precorrin-5B (C(1))-methyltransferase [Pseudomonadota bacterium]